MILVPYFAEQYAYWLAITKADPGTTNQAKKITQGYGWRFIWDASYFSVLISAGFRIIFVQAPFSYWEWMGYLGFLTGVLLRISAIRVLGKFYDPGIAIKVDHQMIQSGPYRILRHPLHLGTVLQITGLAFFAPIWLRWPAVIASLVLGLYLNRTEDRTHLEHLGTEFKSYYLKTWDIVDLFHWKNRSE